jgi:hypothetical protein
MTGRPRTADVDGGVGRLDAQRPDVAVAASVSI